MAESNSPRFGLRVWSAGTDTPSRSEFKQSFDALELLAVKFGQGLLSARPPASEGGRFYFATDAGVLTYDNGATWVDPGAGGGLTKSLLLMGG